MGGAPGVGALAARRADAAVPVVLLRGAGDLPAAGGAGRQRRRAGRRPDPVAGVHAGGDRAAVGDRRAAVRAAGRVLRRRAVRGRWARRCIWARSPPTTPCRCSWSRWPPGAWSGPGTGEATGWMVAAGAALALANAAAYSSVLFDLVVLAARAADRAARPGGRLAARRCATVLTVTVAAAADRRAADRRQHATSTGFEQTTLARAPGDRRPAVGAGRFLVLGRALSSPWPRAASIISWASRARARPQTWLLAVLTAAARSGRWSRRACTPPPR